MEILKNDTLLESLRYNLNCFVIVYLSIPIQAGICLLKNAHLELALFSKDE